jgi:hypothetical protein
MGTTMTLESEAIAKEVQTILEALDTPPVDAETHSMFCGWLHLRRKFPDILLNEPYSAEDQIVLVCRAISESNGNGDALIEPIVRAVVSCLRPEWTSKGLAFIEAFDQIPLRETLRSLEALFGEKGAGHLPEVLRRKLWQIFGPDDGVVAKPVKACRAMKLPSRITRVPVVEKRVALGLALLELKAKSRRTNDFSALRKKHFGDVEPMLAIEATRVARVFGRRPDIYRRMSWQALVELSSPSLSAPARLRFETAIIAGKDIKVPQIKRARGRLPSGRPRQERAAARMAAYSSPV